MIAIAKRLRHGIVSEREPDTSRRCIPKSALQPIADAHRSLALTCLSHYNRKVSIWQVVRLPTSWPPNPLSMRPVPVGSVERLSRAYSPGLAAARVLQQVPGDAPGR